MYVCICVSVGYEYTCDMHVLDVVSQKLHTLFFETSSLWELVLIVWDRLVDFGHLLSHDKLDHSPQALAFRIQNEMKSRRRHRSFSFYNACSLATVKP